MVKSIFFLFSLFLFSLCIAQDSSEGAGPAGSEPGTRAGLIREIIGNEWVQFGAPILVCCGIAYFVLSKREARTQQEGARGRRNSIPGSGDPETEGTVGGGAGDGNSPSSSGADGAGAGKNSELGERRKENKQRDGQRVSGVGEAAGAAGALVGQEEEEPLLLQSLRQALCGSLCWESLEDVSEPDEAVDISVCLTKNKDDCYRYDTCFARIIVQSSENVQSELRNLLKSKKEVIVCAIFKHVLAAGKEEVRRYFRVTKKQEYNDS